MASKRLRELLYKTRGIYKYYIESFVIELVDPKGSEIVRVENTKREVFNLRNRTEYVLAS